MKRYLCFLGSIYYPRGGFDDFIGSYDSQEEAHAACINHPDYDHRYGWWHIFDTTNGQIIRE